MKEVKIIKFDIDGLMELACGGSVERFKIQNFQPFLGFSVVISCFIIWDRVETYLILKPAVDSHNEAKISLRVRLAILQNVPNLVHGREKLVALQNMAIPGSMRMFCPIIHKVIHCCLAHMAFCRMFSACMYITHVSIIVGKNRIVRVSYQHYCISQLSRLTTAVLRLFMWILNRNRLYGIFCIF